MTNAATSLLVKVVPHIADIAPADWDACANPDPAKHDPFVSHAFLSALEEAGTIGAETGWIAQHLLLQSSCGETIGCMPLYLKLHSQGEFIFDHGWADAYARAGGNYYPKLQGAVPFTPVPGCRLLIKPGRVTNATRLHLARAAIELTRRHQASSLHITFLSEQEWTALGSDPAAKNLHFLQRTGSQFHWLNNDYNSFDDFLATLASRKRKVLRKERRQALVNGISIEHLCGADIKEQHWDAFYAFYLDTSNRKWGQPYLNREFFSLLGQAMADHCLLILARRDGELIAGALNIIGGDCLYGRYWGAAEHHPFLHFEVCYYQAIDYAIAHKLARVEAGAQGEHKLVRGYVPLPTYSLHWIDDPNFRAAVDDYLQRERRHTELERHALAEFTPFKKSQ